MALQITAGAGMTGLAPLWSPAARGDGRNMLRPYDSVRTFPSQPMVPCGDGETWTAAEAAVTGSVSDG